MSKKQELVPVKGLLPSTEVIDYGDHAGVGMDVGMNEMLIPFLGLLQSGSDELNARNPKFIEAAKAGQMINRATQELHDELTLVVATRTHSFVEWIPRTKGGGFVAVHLPESDVLAKARERAAKSGDSSRFPKLTTEAGNDLVETFSLFCIQADGSGNPAGFIVVSFSGTKIAAYKQFRTQIGKIRGARTTPLYGFVAKLTSFDDSNAKGSYKNYRLEPVTGDALTSRIPPGHPLFMAAVDLKSALETGKARADYETATPESAASDDGVF